MTPARAGRIGRGWRVAAAILLAAVVASLSGLRSWSDQHKGMRPANRSEEFFRYIAQELGEPSLCERIPWTVESPGGFFTSPSYERSECYDFIAGRTTNPWLCWKVKRLGAFSLLDNQTSMWSCLSRARHGWFGGMAISHENMAFFFNRMGYAPGALPLDIASPDINAHATNLSTDQIYDVYDRFLDEVQKTGDAQHVAARLQLVGRVRLLPDTN